MDIKDYREPGEAEEGSHGTVIRRLLVVTAALEAATGLALAAYPRGPVSLLLGESLDSLGGQVVARVAGAALLALGLACWLARDEDPSRGARSMVAAMLLYNVAAVAALAHARLGLGLSGAGLWPAILLHTALAAWCIACLRSRGPDVGTR